MPRQSYRSKQETYRYESLETEQSLRLLKIVPAESDAGTEASWEYSLLTTNTEDAPQYETLSYVWGTPHRSRSLELSDGTLLRTTRTLKRALPHIAKYCSTGYLWVDQVCINQDDLSERAQQVSIMGAIYSRCARVLVWLGLVHKLEPGIAAQCSSLDSVVSVNLSSYSMWSDWSHKHAGDAIRDMVESKHKQKDLLGLCGNILESPWFSRAWVFQEVVLPRKSAFILQNSMIPPFNQATVSLSTLYELCKTTWKLEQHNLSTSSCYWVLKEMHDRWADINMPSSQLPMPLDLVLSTLSAEAETSRAHDQLYAFFGMNQDDRICLKPSYEISLQAALVATARSIVEGTKSLDIFETLPRSSKTKATPSWVPDFTAHRLVMPFLPLHTPRNPIARSEMYSWNGRCDGRTLWVHGRVVATVDVNVDHEISTSEEDINRAYLPLLPSIIKAWTTSEHYDPDRPLPVLESILPALLGEGHCGTSTYDPEDTTGFAILTMLRYWWFAINKEKGTTFRADRKPPVPDREVDKRTVSEYIKMVMHGRRLHITQDGRLATGSGLRRGDLICVLHGCSHPVALRHIPKKDAYEVVSTCYLEDWMDPWNRETVHWKEDEAQEFVLI